MHIFWGIVGILSAYLLVRYRRNIYDFTGAWSLVERWMGYGSTPTAIVILAIIVFLIALTAMTGHLQRLLGTTTGTIF